MTEAERFDGAPMTFDPEHPDLGWTYAEAVPYECPKPSWWERLLVGLVLRRQKCRRRRCWWPAEEEGWVCCRHDPANLAGPHRRRAP